MAKRHKNLSSITPIEAAVRSLCSLNKKARDHESICQTLIHPSLLLRAVELELADLGDEEGVIDFYLQDVAGKVEKAFPRLNINPVNFAEALAESLDILASQLANEENNGGSAKLDVLMAKDEEMRNALLQKIVEDDEADWQDYCARMEEGDEEDSNEGL